eukprot:gnl/TRDRNA2_/TRDRNA2_167145_c0_seq2.p1 gnl/TRDRNA2_/TRDRNA2_167145_c0~~gnl/TRDRNA2_/TRDRNA2_167145_c0_seq2.p1  ORF type:complete len:180 (+),score=37.88 gnl/TRDRNA2_/TRDRNA2_167145_c0_seq2:68-607(+)
MQETMTTIDFFEAMHFVHSTMPGQSLLTAALGNVCGFTHTVSYDTSEMFLVTLYTFVGWYLMSRLLHFLAKPKVKAICPIDVDDFEDELEEMKDEDEQPFEVSQASSVIVSGKCQSAGMVLLEQYGVLGAEPGFWAVPLVERPEPKRSVAKQNLGWAVLEQYGVLDAAEGSWEHQQYES